MAFFDVATVNLAVAIFIVVALAEFSKYRQTRAHAFRLLAASGILFLVSGVFSLPEVFGLTYHSILGDVFQLLGELAAIVAVLYLVIDSLKDWRKDFKL